MADIQAGDDSNAIFHQFTKLPTELRLKIWRLAAQQQPPHVIDFFLPQLRPISHGHQSHPQTHTSRQSKSTLPAIALAHPEAIPEIAPFYTTKPISRMEIRFSNPHQTYRPKHDIIFSAEVPPLRYMRLRCVQAALSYPLECLSETPSDVKELRFVAVTFLPPSTEETAMRSFVDVLKRFEKLEVLYLVLNYVGRDTPVGEETSQEVWEEIRRVKMYERVFVEPVVASPIFTLESLERAQKVVEDVGERLKEWYTEDWKPELRLRSCVKGWA